MPHRQAALLWPAQNVIQLLLDLSGGAHKHAVPHSCRPARAGAAVVVRLGGPQRQRPRGRACWSSRPASRSASERSWGLLPCRSPTPRTRRRASLLAASPSMCGSCSSGAGPSTPPLAAPALRRAARGTACVRAPPSDAAPTSALPLIDPSFGRSRLATLICYQLGPLKSMPPSTHRH